MRKLCLPLTLIAVATAAFAIGCEDGPDQTFQPAPANAGNIWNNGNVNAAVVTGVSPQFDAGFPTVNAVTLCSTDFKRQRWAWMLTQPIKPPRQYAGIDLAKDNLWDGLTIDEAESQPASPTSPEGGLCQSVPLGFEGTCPSGIGGCNGNYWGNNQEVGFSWNVATHILDQMTLQLGYTGSLTTGYYPDNNGESHYYQITIGDVYRRDGVPFEINWNSQSDRETKITNIFNAIMATYAQAAGVPFNTASCSNDNTCQSPGTTSNCQCLHVTTGTATQQQACQTGQSGKCGVVNCGSDGNCLINPNNGGGTYFGIRPMVVYVVGNAGVPQPALSTPTEIYNFFTKWEPYSNLNQLVTLDQDGPTASGQPVGTPSGSTIQCNQHIGQTFADLRDNCVQVTGDKANPDGVDAVNLNKILHGLSHDQEHWTANVLGVNQNFTSASVAANPNAVVLDNDTPQSGDVTQDYEFDLRARGDLANDYTEVPANPATGDPAESVNDMRGSSLMMIEWARLLLEDVATILSKPGPWNPGGLPVAPKKLGDPGCVGFGANNVPNYVATNANPATFGCSGIEGLIIPSYFAFAPPSQGGGFLGVATDFSKDPGIATADTNANLNPTSNYDQLGFYAPVLKPGDLFGALCIDANSSTDCADQALSIWTNMLNQVVRVLGNGNILNLPSEMQDRRYYFKWFGIAFTKYLKAYGNYKTQFPNTVNNFPDGTAGGGLGPVELVNTHIDLEALFFDYQVAPGTGGAQTYDKFEYVDRTTIGLGNGGADNYIPWDFEYGCDLLGGNQRYDNWYRRMDREEIGMYSAMLENKSDTPGKENNVNITNLFGSPLLAGNPAAGVNGAFGSYQCAIGTAGDPLAGNGCSTNPPLDPAQPGLAPCGPPSASYTSGTCAGTDVCAGGPTFEQGFVSACGVQCDYATYPSTGCAAPSQVCVTAGAFVPDDGGAPVPLEGCIVAQTDKNGTTNDPDAGVVGRPYLWHYPGVWSRTPYSAGHSPITLGPSDKHPEIGVAHVTVPNFPVDPKNPFGSGPYTNSPTPPTTQPDGGLACNAGYTQGADGLCNLTIPTTGTGNNVPFFNPLTPWSEVQPGIGFAIPVDGQRNQWVSSGQFDYTGVLESYIVDYVPWVDTLIPGCVAGPNEAGVSCSPGYNCDPVSKNCVDADNTLQILAIEGADFLGQAFLCQDPSSGDILHVGMYDSALSIENWLQAHPGTNNPLAPTTSSAQIACQIIVRRTPYNNYIDQITSKAYGVTVNISGGQGLGRISDIVLFDPSLIQAL